MINGKLVTRPLGPEILPGVTREVVLAIGRRLGLPVEERCVSLEEAYAADEIFLTGSGEEIRSVVRLDGREIGIARPGPIATTIIDLFLTHTRNGGTYEQLL